MEVQRGQRERHVEDERCEHHRYGEKARVARTDQDAVEREDDRGRRLHRREQRPDRVQPVDHARVAGEDVRQRPVQRQQHETGGAAADERQRHQAPRRRVGPGAVARAEHPPDHHLSGDRERVEHERQQVVELEGDLVGAERSLADPGEHGARNDERHIQGARADCDLGSDAREPAHQPRLRARQRPRDCDERGAHRELCDNRAERRTVE